MSEDRVALYVRIPAAEAERLDRAAFLRKAPKQEIVADLLARHLGDADVLWERPLPDGPPRRVTIDLPGEGLTVGHAAVRPAAAPEVLTLSEAAELLQVEQEALAGLVEQGEVPGRRIGEHWRFSRSALLAWLGG